MITRTSLSYQSTAVAAGRADDHRPVSRRRFAAFIPALLVAGLTTGASASALADPPPPPSADHVWGGCVLTTGAGGAVAGIEESLDEGDGISSSRVDFVLAYSLPFPNDGQIIDGGVTTGPVLCINPDNVDIETTEENTPIPGGTGTLDITALEQALILQYEKAGGIREKRICHTAADNTDCFLITPVSGSILASPPPTE